jgi:hypothetical protein
MFRRQQPVFYAFDLLWLEHVGRRGYDLFRVVCSRDMEGIVGKLAHAPYLMHPSSWFKVTNPTYSQLRGRHDVFAPRAARAVR